MASPYSILAKVESSNLPSREKSSIRRWLEKASDGGMATAGSMGRAGMHVVRSSGEGLVVGAALGAAHSELKTGLDVKKIPMDAGLGVFGALTSILLSEDGDGLGVDARNVATTGFGVFAFRKTYDLLAEKRLASGKAPGGTFGPAQAAKVAGELGDDDLDSEEDGGYIPEDGIDEGYLTSEDEVESDDSFGEDPIIAAAREL